MKEGRQDAPGKAVNSKTVQRAIPVGRNMQEPWRLADPLDLLDEKALRHG